MKIQIKDINTTDRNGKARVVTVKVDQYGNFWATLKDKKDWRYFGDEKGNSFVSVAKITANDDLPIEDAPSGFGVG